MQKTVKTRVFVPFIKYREHQIAGCRRNDKGSSRAGLSFIGKARHVPLNYLSFILSLNSVSDISRLTVCRDLIFFVYPSQCGVLLAARLCKYLCHLTEMKQQMDFCGDCTKYSSQDFDVINFVLYLS